MTTVNKPYTFKIGNCLYCGQYNRVLGRDECLKCWRKEKSLKDQFEASWFTDMKNKTIQPTKKMVSRRKRVVMENKDNEN